MKKWNDPFPETPDGFHLAVEETLNNLEEKQMKSIFKKTPVLVFALLTVMIAATAFAATALFSGTVDWNGNFTPTDMDGMALETIPPETVENVDAAAGLIADVPDGEYWEAWTDGGGSGSMGFIGQRISNTDGLAAALEGLPLVVPDTPEGYMLDVVELFYDMRGLEMEQYSEETVGNVRLIKYRVPEPAQDDTDGYWLSFTAGDIARVTIDASLHRLDEYEELLVGDFYVAGGDSYEAIEVHGVDRAIMITGADGMLEIRMQIDIDDECVADYCIYSTGDMTADELIALMGF